MHQKISNERITKELSLMFEGNKPHCALYLIYKYNILDACLKLPLNNQELEKNLSSELTKIINMVLTAGYLLENIITLFPDVFVKKYLKYEENMIKKEDRKSIFFSLLSVPLRNYKIKLGKENVSISKAIAKESLKLNNELIKEIVIYATYIDEFMIYIENGEFERLTTGNLIRKIKHPFITKLIFLSICQENKVNMLNTQIDQEHIKMIINKYMKWIYFVEENNLFGADEMKPAFDGLQIQKLLDMKPCKELGILNEFLIETQINFPNYNSDQLLELLKQKKAQLIK